MASGDIQLPVTEITCVTGAGRYFPKPVSPNTAPITTETINGLINGFTRVHSVFFPVSWFSRGTSHEGTAHTYAIVQNGKVKMVYSKNISGKIAMNTALPINPKLENAKPYAASFFVYSSLYKSLPIAKETGTRIATSAQLINKSCQTLESFSGVQFCTNVLIIIAGTNTNVSILESDCAASLGTIFQWESTNPITINSANTII